MTKLEYNARGDAIIATGHRAFDRQCNLVCTGNVSASGFHGAFIRAHSETECNGFTNPPGHLQEFDLTPFVEDLRAPERVLRAVREHTKDKTIQLYACWHSQRLSCVRHRRIVHGYILTTTDHKLIAKLKTGPTWKSRDVLDWVAERISN